MTKSDPTLPLIRPISGVTTSESCGLPPPDRPAESSSSAIALTPDHDRGVGPLGAAHAAMTSRAPSKVPDCSAAWSIAASCASAPSTVCGKPVGTPAGPVLVAAGIAIAPGSRVDTMPGVETSSPTDGIVFEASASRAACGLLAAALVDGTPDPGRPGEPGWFARCADPCR